MRIVFLILACSVVAGANAEAELPQGLEECGAFAQAQMRQCLAKKRQESEARLVAAQRAATSAIEHWDEDPKFKAQAQEKFRQSSSAFINYRDAQCAFVVSLGGGAIGNALEMRRSACIYGLNSSRTADLKAAIANLPTR
jgi:uncharacterized protein YecT (DUF1311 family)